MGKSWVAWLLQTGSTRVEYKKYLLSLILLRLTYDILFDDALRIPENKKHKTYIKHAFERENKVKNGI